jgi:outer membrane lipoprotein-sorting protein
MNNSRDDELVRPLERLGALQPEPEAAGRAINRVRRALEGQPASDLMRRIVMRRSFTVAASVLLAGGAVLAWYLTSLAPANAAFPDVLQALREPRSVTCLQSTSRDDRKGSETIRLFILDNGLWRAELPGGFYTVSDNVKHRVLTVNTVKKEAVLLLGVNAADINLYQKLKDLPSDASARAVPRRGVDAAGTLVFEVKLNSQVLRVQIDPKTRLPVQIDSSGKDADGHVIDVSLHQIAFHKELDARLFSFDPPAGYKVETKGIAELPAPPRDAPRKDLTVKPGVGVGEVKFGMTREEVEKILGKPDTTEEAPKGGAVTLNYYSCGLFISVGKARGVGVISCMARSIMLVRINDFPGKTDKGIALGASAADIIRAYGEPDSKTDSGGSTSLSYRKLPADFQFVGGKLVQIMLNRPRPAK